MPEKISGPKIICFLCKWCSYAGADLAGTSRMEHEPNNINIRVKCSGRIDPQHILFAFKQGADGVLIAGCHPGDCHYQDGNYKTERKVFMLKRVLTDLGISPERLHLEWISASEGKKFAKTVNSFTKKIKSLGPLKL